MNNGEQEIDDLFKSLSNEVLNLKTAHERPLGALAFFRDDLSFTVNLTEQWGSYSADFYVTVQIEETPYKPPIVQVGWDIPAGFIYTSVKETSIDQDYTTWTYKLELFTSSVITSASMNFSVISSQPIESITWGYY